MVLYDSKPLTKSELRQLRKEIIESCSEFDGVTEQVNISRWIKVEPIVLPKFRLHGKVGFKRKPYPCSYSIQDSKK